MDILPNNILKQIVRDENGLIKGLEYKYTNEGYIDWRAMIPSQFLYVNNSLGRREQLEKKYGKSYKEIDPINDQVDDIDLVIMLAGIKYLLKLRGYKKVNYLINQSGDTYSAVQCNIDFIPNYETENREISFSDNACAHLGNTNDFGQKYLVEMATNRSFCRVVRNFLNINIVSKEELGKDNEENTKINIAPQKQVKLLEDALNAKKLQFDPHIKEKLIKEGKWQEQYKSIYDLPKDIIFDYLERLKRFNPEV